MPAPSTGVIVGRRVEVDGTTIRTVATVRSPEEPGPFELVFPGGMLGDRARIVGGRLPPAAGARIAFTAEQAGDRWLVTSWTNLDGDASDPGSLARTER